VFLLSSDPGSCMMAFDGEIQVVGVKVEGEDPEAITFPTIRTESENCVSLQRSDPGSCLMAFDGEIQVVGVKVEGEDPEAITFPTIRTENENCMAVMLDECGSCTGMCQTSSGDGNQSCFVNAEGFMDIVEEEPRPSTFAVMQPEPANCVFLLSSDPGSCMMAFDGEIQVVGVKVEGEDREAITFPTIRTESENCVLTTK